MTRRIWLMVGAGLIAALELWLAVVVWIERITEDRTRDLGSGVTVTVPSDLGPVWGDVLFSAATAAAGVAIVTGLYQLNRRPQLARNLILAGLAPATLAGAVFFWFPPFWLITAVAIAAMVGVVREVDQTRVLA